MLRHRKPFKSHFEIGEFETKRRKLRDNNHKRSVQDDGKNGKLDNFEENHERSGKDTNTSRKSHDEESGNEEV